MMYCAHAHELISNKVTSLENLILLENIMVRVNFNNTYRKILLTNHTLLKTVEYIKEYKMNMPEFDFLFKLDANKYLD